MERLNSPQQYHRCWQVCILNVLCCYIARVKKIMWGLPAETVCITDTLNSVKYYTQRHLDGFKVTKQEVFPKSHLKPLAWTSTRESTPLTVIRTVDDVRVFANFWKNEFTVCTLISQTENIHVRYKYNGASACRRLFVATIIIRFTLKHIWAV